MLALIIIAGTLFYVFGGIFTFRAMVRLDIGISHYKSEYTGDEYFGPVFGGIFWIFFWIGCAFYKGSGEILDTIEESMKEEKE